MVSKALSKIHLENYGEIVHAFLFSVAGSQEVLFNNRQAEKWWRTQFAMHPLSKGPQDVKEHHKAVRKERRQGLYMPLSWNLVQRRNMGQLLGSPDILLSLLYILPWFISRILPPLPLHFSVNGTTIHLDALVQKLFSLRGKQNCPGFWFQRRHNVKPSPQQRK